MYKEDGRTYLEDHDLDVLEAATMEEARHRLYNDRSLLWEALGPDALPNDSEQAKALEDAIAAALVDGTHAELGKLVANMALEYAFRCCHDQIVDDWERYVDDTEARYG
jgi:hypothetical protein